MKKYTEKEFNHQGQHFAFRLRNLYLNDADKFYQLQDYYPFPVYINERKTSEYHFFNDCFISQAMEIENLFTKGISYLDEISNPILLKNSVDKSIKLHESNDYDQICNYLQAIYLNKKMTPFFTSKILINDELTLNTPFFPSENTVFEKVFKELIPAGEKSLNHWLRFQSLTRREKEIVKLIAEGNSSKEVGEELFISFNSVKSHRKNIYTKLDINKTSELVRLAIFLELIHAP